jgi:hypothetical protein
MAHLDFAIVGHTPRCLVESSIGQEATLMLCTVRKAVSAMLLASAVFMLTGTLQAMEI